jgi:hypothetical protein
MIITPTGQRERAIDLAASAPQEAAVVARNIEDPWFRCQALAHVARYWPDENYGKLLREASAAADSQDNWYKRVTVSAWPIRAYLERGNPGPVKGLLERYVDQVHHIENLGGRSEALLMLFQAARPFDRHLWEPVFHALVKATEPALAWRQTRNIRNAVAMVASDNPRLVQNAITALSDEKIVAAIVRDVGCVDKLVDG